VNTPTEQSEPTHEPPRAARPRPARADVLDDALDRLSGYGYIDGAGLATHAPMGAEALSTLGHDDLVVAWVEDYKARHEPIDTPPATVRLDPGEESDWRSALGDPARLSDWAELFTHQLQDHRWQDVVGTWVPRLVAGYAGAFTHGLIRTAHAVRALETTPDPSPLVTAELARALAYWAGSYKTLPGHPTLAGTRSLDEALERLPRPHDAWTPIEAGQFLRIHELTDFADAVEALGPPASLDAALSDLTAAFARMMLANPDVHPFGLVHAVTPVAGARTLLPYLPTVPTEQIYAQLWHIDAAITSGFVPRPTGANGPSTNAPAPTAGELIALAAEHKDPHVVKFTEACLREDGLRPDPVYRLAAQHVIDRTPPW
jgi:hypothetical protein